VTDLQQLFFGGLLVIAATLFISLITAPFEAMTWWSRWTTEPDGEADENRTSTEAEVSTDRLDATSKAVIFYVTGIGTMAGDFHPELEKHFLEELKRLLPDVTVIDNFFPYSPAGIPLNGQRIFARFWRFLGRHRAFVTKTMIRLRNMFQVLVAADGRYGPIYSAGTYRTMREKLTSKGYTASSNQPIILLGYSGGAEISLGAAPFLQSAFHSRLTLLSLGGVLSSHAGLAALDRLVHIQGSADRVAKIGGIFFIHRWRLFGSSYWNLARKQGKFTKIGMPGISHNGPGGYLDAATVTRGADANNLQRTLAVIRSVVDAEIAEESPDG
jgi:hypothetical protein